jgi:hypothetical protein
MASESRSSRFLWLSVLLAPLPLLLAGCGGPNLIELLMQPRWGCGTTIVIVLDIVALIDLLDDDHRSTLNRALWTLLIVLVPLGGVILYFLFGRE